MKVLKKVLIVLLGVIFALSLVACGKGDIPKFDGKTEKMTEQQGIEKFEEITGRELGYELKNYSGFSANGDYSKYTEYAKKCENEGFVNQGEMKNNDVSATLFSSTEKDNIMMIVCYQSGKIYVLQFEVEGSVGSQEAVAEWPTVEDMAVFHVNLTEPSGVKIRHVNLENPQTNAFVKYATLNIILTECNSSVFNSLVSQIKRAGYTLGKREDNNQSQYDYMGSMVKNGVEYFVRVSFVADQEGMLNIEFENKTERYISDYGVTPANLFDQATVGIKESGQSYRPDDNGGESLQYVEDTIYFSFNNKYFLEWYGERSDANADKKPDGDKGNVHGGQDKVEINGIEDYISSSGAWLTEIGTENYYNIIGEYKNKYENASEEYTVATYAARRSLSAISTYYASAIDLQKTGKTQVIAGKTCSEYVGKTGVTDGEFISWDATFYVWEEYDLPMKYIGKQYWNREQLDYTAEYVYFEQTSFVDKYAAYPIYGEKIPFPADKIETASGLDFIPQVSGADGYTTEKTGISPDGNTNRQTTRFNAHGVSESEFESYKQAVVSAGFENIDGKFYYDLGNNTRVVMELHYLYGEDTAYFYFYTEEYDPLSKPTMPTLSTNTIFVFKGENGSEQVIYAMEFYGDKIYVSWYSNMSFNGYVYVKNGDMYEKFQGIKGDNQDYSGNGTVGSYGSQDIIAAINGDFDNNLYFGDFTYVQKTGEETVLGINTIVYEGVYGEKINVSVDYGFVVKSEYRGNFELIAIEDGEFTSAFPALEYAQGLISYGMESYFLKNYGGDMATYLYLRETYSQIYKTYRRVEIQEVATLNYINNYFNAIYINNYFNAIDGLAKADSFDGASVGKTYYVVYDSKSEYSDEYSYSFNRNLIITDGKNVMEVNASYNESLGDMEKYTYGHIYVTEFSLYGTAKDYFGDEFQTDVEFSDYTAFGTSTITVSQKVESDNPNMDGPMPMRPEKVIIDFGGKMVMREWGDFFYFDGSTPTKGGYINEDSDGKYISYGSETTATKEEFIAGSIGYNLAKKYNTAGMSKESGMWLDRECVIYKGYYTYRGIQYELEIWEDVETGANLYVKRENETYGYKSYTVYSIDSIEVGAGIGMTEEEFLALPVK